MTFNLEEALKHPEWVRRSGELIGRIIVNEFAPLDSSIRLIVLMADGRVFFHCADGRNDYGGVDNALELLPSCAVCGQSSGAITGFRIALKFFGYPPESGYAHANCIRRLQTKGNVTKP